MPFVKLDDRLSRAAAMFPACAYGADIGADHGRLSCFLLETGKCARMGITDISAPSLQKARDLITLKGLGDRADFCVGDGLSALPHPADAIAILGMGGNTVSNILLKGGGKLEGAVLVLSAQTEIPLLRRTLSALHYRIEDEQIAFSANRYYVLLRAAPGDEELSDRQLFLGPRLMEKNADSYEAYLAWRIERTLQKRSEEGRGELSMLKEEEQRVRYCKNH